MNVVETILNFLYVYMAAIDGRPQLRATAPLVGLSVAIMTFWKTALYWLQVSKFLTHAPPSLFRNLFNHSTCLYCRTIFLVLKVGVSQDTTKRTTFWSCLLFQMAFGLWFPPLFLYTFTWKSALICSLLLDLDLNQMDQREVPEVELERASSRSKQEGCGGAKKRRNTSRTKEESKDQSTTRKIAMHCY